MRNLSLNIAAILGLIGAVLSVVMGVIYLASGSVMLGMLLIFMGTPVCIALAVVFDYVGERMRRDVVEGNFRSKRDVIDTPWENNPEYDPNPNSDASSTRKYNPHIG